jgi:Terpene synthase family 2, C-terminal metal binding
MPASAIGYLTALPAAERRQVLDAAGEVAAACEGWLRAYPIVRRPSVTAACSLVSTVALRGADLARLAVLTRWWLWIFGVDDVFDDPDADDAAVTSWTRRFIDDFPTGRDDGDPLRAALGSIHGELSRFPLFAGLAARWQAGMVGVVQGMLLERGWNVAASPTFEEYLATGMTTIAVRPYTITACVLADEPAAAAAFDTLDPMIESTARCFRLANDLRSEARERQEGKLNAVTLLHQAYAGRGLGDEQAMAAARRRLRESCLADLAALETARRAAPPAVATLAQFLWAHAAFVWDMYQDHDYDTVSTLLRAGAIS